MMRNRKGRKRRVRRERESADRPAQLFQQRIRPEEDTEARNKASMNQDTMTIGEPHEAFKAATWRNLMIPRGSTAVPETENEMETTTKIEA